MDPGTENINEASLQHHKTGYSWVELSVALCALVVSVSSLFVAVHHGRTMEKLVTANSLPWLQIYTSNTDASGNVGIITLTMVNAGVGPARIDKVWISYHGQPMTTHVELLQACCAIDGEHQPYIIFSTISHRMLAARQDVNFLTMKKTDEGAQTFAKFDQERESIDIRACYCSVFDQCWIAATHAPVVEPVKSCAALEGPEYKE